MAKIDVQLKKTLYNATEFSKVVSKEFKTFTTTAETPAEITVEEFFKLYEQIYLEIPVNGDINSHSYLVARSGTLVDVDSINEEIQPLLEEINQLRSEILAAQEEINQLNLKLVNGGN